MKIFGFEINRLKNSSIGKPEIVNEPTKQASYPSTIISYGSIALPYDGEKNLGAMGKPTTYVPNYYLLSTRSWQAYTDSPIAKTIIDKWTNWILDSGLKLKTNPAKVVLKSEGIDMSKDQSEAFNDIVECRWDVWANSKKSSYTNEETFNESSKSIFINSKISGDCLVILRYIKGIVKIQYIDGARVKTPSLFKTKQDSGNIISNGVEISSSGVVVGYHVQMKDSLSFEFVPAYSASTGLRTSYLVKGSRWRMDYHRGFPSIATVLETMSTIDRYREATVGSAEEVAKIAYQVVHQNYSDGSTPLQQSLMKAIDASNDELPTDSDGELLANRIASTTGKQVFNMTKGAELKTVNQSNNVQGFDAFHNSNAGIICASVGIPLNVAMSIYNDSFSASRAATKDWDHTMDVERCDFSKQHLEYVYKFWFYTEVLSNKIPAIGYLLAFQNDNFMITESYEKVRFTGPMFPHIDPLKEVKAEREKLGEFGKGIPLTTAEQATEALGGGDSDSNVEQFADEVAKLKELNLVAPEPQPIVNPVPDKKKVNP